MSRFKEIMNNVLIGIGISVLLVLSAFVGVYLGTVCFKLLLCLIEVLY